MSVRS